MTASNIHYEMAEKRRAVNCGGIGAIHLMVNKLGLCEEIDSRLHLLKKHLPYHELKGSVIHIDTSEGIVSRSSMARPLRIEYGGAIYQVVNRGDRREEIFWATTTGAIFSGLPGRRAGARTGKSTPIVSWETMSI